MDTGGSSRAHQGRVLLALESVVGCAADASPANAEEEARLASISAMPRRKQFLAGRWLARKLLCIWVGGGMPTDWSIESAKDGRPWAVARGAAAARLFLSISHSGDRIACAVSDGPVGIDVEAWPPRHRRDIAALFEAAMSDRELAYWIDGAADPALTFHRAWVQKEAWLKSRGEPLALGRLRELSIRPVRPDDAMAGAELVTEQEVLGLFAPAGASIQTVGSAISLAARWAIDDLGQR